METNTSSNVLKVLRNETPDRFVYAPNYWQWFAHHLNHGILPDEIAHCKTQLDLIQYLGLDVFSRNIYCKQTQYWFGGICDEKLEGVKTSEEVEYNQKDKLTTKQYQVKQGKLSEKLLYVFNESTVVQKEFLVKDYSQDAGLLETFVGARRWEFNKENFESIQKQVGTEGVTVVGDFFSPLKMLHLTMGPINSVYFLMEQPEYASRLMKMHENAQLELVKQAVSGGVEAIMSMDNLDTMFHPPEYVEQYSASFYEKASSICHDYGARFFIHACGNQKENLGLISSLGVDGLEGVAYPPLGNVSLEEAMEMTSDRFIITGGISAIETRDLTSRLQVFTYVKELFSRLEPYKNRFMLSASCNTPVNTPWETIKHFRDAWLEYK